MSQSKRRGSARRRKAEQLAQDLSLQRLGWYVRNCAHCPLARMLERALMKRYDLFHEAHEDDMASLPEALPADQKELSTREKLRASRDLLETYAEPPYYEGVYEQNVAFACAECGLNTLDAELLF